MTLQSLKDDDFTDAEIPVFKPVAQLTLHEDMKSHESEKHACRDGVF